MPAMIRTDFAPQCLHRIPLRVASCIEPPLNSRLTKLNWLSGDGMMPLFGCQAFELLLELAPVGRSSQQGADHVTVWRWVQRYAPEMERRLRSKLKPTNDSWRVDETYIRVKGKWVYLYRAVDSTGATVVLQL